MVSKTKRLIFVSALAFSLLTAGAYGVTVTYAQDTTIHQTLVEKIANKFNLKTTDVQAVFDQVRQERQAEMAKKYEQMLTDAVGAGKLTEAQKQLLITKHAEIMKSRETQMSSFQSMTETERHTAMEKDRTELAAWAKTNGIDETYLFGFGKGGGHKRGHDLN